MLRVLRPFAVLGLMFGLAGVASADDKAKEVIEKAIKAHGGEDVLTKRTSGSMKAKGRVEVAGGIDFTSENHFQLPDKFEETVMMEIGGQKATVVVKFDGKKATMTVNGMDLPGADKLDAEIKDAVGLMKIATLVPLRNKPYELSVIGEEKVEGKTAVGIKVTAKGQKDVDLFFDKESGLMVKMNRRGVDPMAGNEFAEERIITEYTKMNNIPVPKKMLLKRDGNKYIEIEVLEVKYGP
jgi:hypothetical protein